VTVCTTALIFECSVDGIDSISKGHWPIDFRGNIFLLVFNGIRETTTYRTKAGG
jgi:hypothetical protein